MKYKVGDIVLVKSPAGDCIPHVHVRLTSRVIVKERKGKMVGIRRSMDWPGYSGWESEIVYQEEADRLRKEWSIPLQQGDNTFVHDADIVKKPRNPEPNIKSKARNRRRIVRVKKP